MNFANIKIRTRLLIGFSIIGLMVITMGIISFFHTQRIWEDTNNLYNHPFKVNIAIREIKTGITSMHRSIKDVILSDNQLEINKYLNRISQDEEKVKGNFDLIYDQFLGSKSAVDSAFAAFEGWKLVRDSTIFLCQAGRKTEAANRSTHSAELYLDMLMSRIGQLEDFAMQKAQSFYSSAEKTKKQLLVQLWLILTGIFAITFGVAYSILKSITGPLNILQKATIEHRNGNYEGRCPIESTNEIGQLATSFNLMANSIQSEIAVKNSLTRISDSMLGQDDLPLFAKALLGAIMKNSQANMGAIYFLNEATSVFEPGFSVGLREENIRSFSDQYYEGEFGMALLEKNMVHITQIPEDTAFDFSAVTGNFRPKEILIVPILFIDKVISIISVATLGSFSLETLETMRIAGKNITAGLSSILAFQKIRDYNLKLDNQNTELELQSKELKLQAEELHEQNAELEMQKRQIDEANQLKSEFLSSMSHELRTPLNSVIALSGVLNKKLKNRIPDDEYSYLEIIERNGKNLLTLINEILDLSRIESGKTEIQLSSFSLQEATQSILETLQIPIIQKNLQIINNLEQDFPLVYTDRSKCYHILQNLIGNAVKFTDQGSIEISAGIFGSEVHILVKDTGIGISQDHIGHIFDQFHQVDGTSSKKHEGTGLGLAIADKYSRLLHGRIEVSSELGKGSVF